MAKYKIRGLVVLIAIMAVGAIFTSSASAECGPGFSSKQDLIQYYKHNPSAAHGFRKELLAHSAYTGYQADETVINWLRSPEQKVFSAPSGYHLTANTFCPNGPGHYQPYPGLLENMPGKPMLWHCDKEGRNCVPILKGYCMNFVMGPPVKKHHPPKHHPCRCHKPPKCKCHHKHKKPKPICRQGTVMIGNGCSPQTNNAQQECEVKPGYFWDSNTLVCSQVQQNGVCSAQSGVVNGNNNTVNQEVKCGDTTEICVGDNVCNNTPPPCGCEPPPCECKPPAEPKVKPEIIPENTQEFELNETTKEAPICARARPGAGTTITAVYLESEYGSVTTPKSYPVPGEKFCNETYKAPSKLPAFRCTESGLDASAEWCDIITWTAEASNGTKVSVKKQVPIIAETPF